MVPIKYWIFRLGRRALPRFLFDIMLDRGIYIAPGSDTRDPEKKVAMYEEYIRRHRLTLKGSTVCVVGYGGGFGVGLYLLERGAKRVILQDPFANTKHWRNSRIPEGLMNKYFYRNGGKWVPRSKTIECVGEELEVYADRNPESADIVFSSSVFEHVSNVDQLVEGCWRLTRSGGVECPFD